MKISEPAKQPLGWVLYDETCGVCSRWVPFWAPTLRRIGYDIASLQSDWIQQRLNVTDDSLMRDVRLLLADGSQVSGADVYRYFMKRIWWAYPFYLLACAPLLRRIFNFAYRTFADNRHRFSRACGLPNRPED